MVELTKDNIKLVKDTLNSSPFYKLIGMEVVDIKESYSRLRIPFKKELLQIQGVAHGGVVASIADAAVAIALFSLVDLNDILSTIELKVNYLAPVKSGEIIAEGRIVHKGSRIALGDAEVRNEGKLVGKALVTYMIIKGEGKELPYQKELENKK
ncbi:MAG: PaaI family thioesterase [Candidatus Jordarchaeum sp.]|uniref:PaaI family thioesterase n=1 Tax=Candidatus Jordarchaeum sp. TaxID=2823881 RepID=UPI00404A7E0F